MDFEEYLIKKKINSDLFKMKESELWNNLKREFQEMNEKSFTSQKLFLINPLRRKYNLS